MNMCTKFSADWDMLRNRSGSTFVFVTDSWTHKHFRHWSENTTKKFSSQSEEEGYGIWIP